MIEVVIDVCGFLLCIAFRPDATVQEQLKRIDALEPKLPMLRLLCQAHHFFPYQQDQILHLLEAHHHVIKS